jgi:hypothetical protein
MSEPEEHRFDAALELARRLDETIARFAVEHASLLRNACDVPSHVAQLDGVVVCTFLGHTLHRLLKDRGRVATERLALTILEQLALVESTAAPGTVERTLQ